MADAAWVALSLVRGVGGRTFSTLVDVFGSPEAVLQAPHADLLAVNGIGEKTAAAIKAADLTRIAESLSAWESAGVRAISWASSAYPMALRTLPDAPPTLFIKGLWPVLPPRAVAIVGTRNPSPIAQEVAKRISGDLAAAGIAVVSGLALGIDAAAHRAAILVPHGITVAVLGCGVLDVYPNENRALGRMVAQRGALISEVWPGARVSTTGLVSRNRIISGLCEACVIIQTDADGGALYAAKAAAKQQRKVFFIDSPMDNPDAAHGIEKLRAAGAISLPPDIRGTDWL